MSTPDRLATPVLPDPPPSPAQPDVDPDVPAMKPDDRGRAGNPKPDGIYPQREVEELRWQALQDEKKGLIVRGVERFISGLRGVEGRLRGIWENRRRPQTQVDIGDPLLRISIPEPATAAMAEPNADATAGMMFVPKPDAVDAPPTDETEPPDQDKLLGQSRFSQLREKVKRLYAERGRLSPTDVLTMLREHPELRDSLIASGVVMTASMILAPTGLGSILPMIGGAAAIKWRESRIRGREKEGEELKNFQRAMYGGLGQVVPREQEPGVDPAPEPAQETRFGRLRNFGARALRLFAQLGMVPERAATMALLLPNKILARLENSGAFAENDTVEEMPATRSAQFSESILNWKQVVEKPEDRAKLLERLKADKQILADLIALKVMNFNVPTTWGEQLGGLLNRVTRRSEGNTANLAEQRKAKLKAAFTNWQDLANTRDGWFVAKIDAILDPNGPKKLENTIPEGEHSEAIKQSLTEIRETLASLKKDQLPDTLNKKAESMRNKVLYARMFGIVGKAGLRGIPRDLQAIGASAESIQNTADSIGSKIFNAGGAEELVNQPGANFDLDAITNSIQESVQTAQAAAEQAALDQAAADAAAQVGAPEVPPVTSELNLNEPNAPLTEPNISTAPDTTVTPEAPVESVTVAEAVPAVEYQPQLSEWQNLENLYNGLDQPVETRMGVVNLLKNVFDSSEVNQDLFNILDQNKMMPALSEAQAFLDSQSGSPNFQEMLKQNPTLEAIWKLGRGATADHLRTDEALQQSRLLIPILRGNASVLSDTVIAAKQP